MLKRISAWRPAGALTLLCVLLLTACSTTRRLSEGEVLYTGVKKMNINPTEKEKLPSEMVSDIRTSLSAKPNAPIPFLSPYVNNPFPVGLWIYNNWCDSCGGLRKWVYDNFSREPVLIQDVKPQVRVQMAKNILDNNGYFGSTANYELLYDKKNPKKARISYDINVSRPYLIDSIIYLNDDRKPIYHFIDSVARRQEYLTVGERFCVDSLESVRINITNRLRNRGYYYFRPEYIEFLADSTITPHSIALKLTLASNTPGLALRQFRVNKVFTTIERQSNRVHGTPDTLNTDRGDLIVMRPARLRENLIPSCITFRKGRLYTVRDMDNTQTRLSRTGLFQNIQIQPIPVDTAAANPLMDVYITCKFDRPMEASVEVNATSKSNSYIGPGLIFGLTHHNLFGGAEKLNLQLNADYEWQTGRGRSSVFNSYEFGLSASLAFPRLLAPGFIRRVRREINWTTFTISGSILNRPHYFKMAQFNLGVAYEWRATRHVLNQFTPFKLTYTKLLKTTHEFDSIMAQNPAIALSFRNQFVPQMNYTYTYDRFLERARINGFNFTASVTEAGNIFSGIWALCGQHGEKKLFGTPFSQFVKGQVQLVYSRRLIRNTDHWLVSRVLIGAEHAYGNSTEVPYTEQFYIGGANSIRAFTVRSIGPGSYRAPKDQVNGYFDQTGTFKLELNSEYRFPLVSILHGAVFVDAGNIWLLKNDPYRPGGKLQASTFLRDIALGTGVGLRVDIGMLVIRGDLGYGLHAPYNTGHSGYFNIPMHNAFAFHLALGYPF
ncbi:MAG: BamA/TamA family outer membrane protein [Bacteroidales bacterium]|nr:BamA/TamA family outer membrane protein [Bacteroidales bacterium]